MALRTNGRESEFATNDWQIEWQIATSNDLGSLETVADPDGINEVEEVVYKYFNDGFQNEKYKFWYFHSEGNTFIKVVVSEGQPNYYMVLTGELPALGMVMFRAEDSNVSETWRDLASQIEQKGKGA